MLFFVFFLCLLLRGSSTNVGSHTPKGSISIFVRRERRSVAVAVAVLCSSNEASIPRSFAWPEDILQTSTAVCRAFAMRAKTSAYYSRQFLGTAPIAFSQLEQQ